MEELIEQIDQNDLPIVNDWAIWVKKNVIGEMLWGVGNFCGCIDKKPISFHGKN